jgi:hypothetical protein
LLSPYPAPTVSFGLRKGTDAEIKREKDRLDGQTMESQFKNTSPTFLQSAITSVKEMSEESEKQILGSKQTGVQLSL